LEAALGAKFLNERKEELSLGWNVISSCVRDVQSYEPDEESDVVTKVFQLDIVLVNIERLGTWNVKLLALLVGYLGRRRCLQ
jgi:hypothetical protein